MTDREKLQRIISFCLAREQYFTNNNKDSPIYVEDQAKVSAFQTIRYLVEDMMEDKDNYE